MRIQRTPDNIVFFIFFYIISYTKQCLFIAFLLLRIQYIIVPFVYIGTYLCTYYAHVYTYMMYDWARTLSRDFFI